MNIGLMQCDHVSEPFQHIIPDYPEAFRALFAKDNHDIALRVYDVCHGELPQSVEECEGYIITGSKHSVYEDIPWIHALANFVRQVHAQKHKLVGICFGHQLLAYALGGKVAKAQSGWGIGTKPVVLQQTKAWMQPEKPSYRLLLSHQDQVLVLPAEAEILGGNEHCPISMIGVGEHMLGIQAHPEFTTPYAEALMDSRVERIGLDPIQAAKMTLSEPTDETTVAHWIDAFLRA